MSLQDEFAQANASNNWLKAGFRSMDSLASRADFIQNTVGNVRLERVTNTDNALSRIDDDLFKLQCSYDRAIDQFAVALNTNAGNIINAINSPNHSFLELAQEASERQGYSFSQTDLSNLNRAERILEQVTAIRDDAHNLLDERDFDATYSERPFTQCVAFN